MKHESHAGTEKFYEISDVLQWGEMKSHIRSVKAFYTCLYLPRQRCGDQETILQGPWFILDKTMYFSWTILSSPI